MAEENILIQKNTLESLIDYQEGSVVSKTIIGKKTGTITLFAFDKSIQHPMMPWFMLLTERPKLLLQVMRWF